MNFENNNTQDNNQQAECLLAQEFHQKALTHQKEFLSYSAKRNQLIHHLYKIHHLTLREISEQLNRGLEKTTKPLSRARISKIVELEERRQVLNNE